MYVIYIYIRTDEIPISSSSFLNCSWLFLVTFATTLMVKLGFYLWLCYAFFFYSGFFVILLTLLCFLYDFLQMTIFFMLFEKCHVFGVAVENYQGAFGCSGGMVIGMVMVIRMEWNRNTDSIMLFGCTFEINS